MDFLTRIRPHLIRQPWLAALWLSGSAALGQSDRWSSVDLHLLVDPAPELASLADRLAELLNATFPDGWTQLGPQRTQHPNALEGITHARLPGIANRGGVYFRLGWTGPAELAAHLASHGPIRLLWAQDALPPEQFALLGTPVPRFQKAERAGVEQRLLGFWQLLALLPPLMNRGEHLAAADLLHRLRGVLTELVVALNGATRPANATRVNQFLGPAQQDAFEKSLHQTENLAESWTGQAVALIVLYRWYAPQLVEIHSLDYPTALEATVLALLSAEVPGWPARITTA
ncbi:MAG: hypothetical protein WBO46_20860 [Caldilineaceae bacterium]